MNGVTHAEGYSKQLEAAARFIQTNDDFLVVSHIQPDGDAAGSTFAMAWMLSSLGKKFTLVNEGEMPGKYMYMAASQHTILNYETVTSDGSMPVSALSFQHVISVDCADYSRMGKVCELFSEDVALLNIDHHATNDLFGSVNLVQSEAAATVEILYDLGNYLNLPFSDELNICIYSGLLTDTGGFRYASTSPKVMQIAADLLQRGVKGHELAEHLLEKLTYPQISLLKKSLNTLTFDKSTRIGWLAVSIEDLSSSGASNDDLDGLVNYPRNVEGVEVGLLFKERAGGIVKVSLRSGGNMDVARIAQSFGGGGHMRAAGCTIHGSLQEAIDQVVREVGKALA
ncbi:DHH family phosphoesterase [Paenibacillus agricola]|uniref:Bifunctional oligoribonuclease/PAP phosphatase NrnA n=1 Tax=Paenibacillus agricola TaxID=2716264 RepID=A0ABX0IYX9_9BACL|nr:bifunctional oligoribonuclease/PAP phosphatase NrnA [Paenibacillus agricola]NHN28336.1 bifunctional oligoribonuclease/PAP phosphatase NrnA [Paenibacillus agricola]